MMRETRGTQEAEHRDGGRTGRPDNSERRALEVYLNSIDLSLATDDAVIANIYEEIGAGGTVLAGSQYSTTSLERLVMISPAHLLVPFLSSLGPSLIYKRLGSRIVESIFRRLFECMYVRNEHFRLRDAVEPVDFAACLNCRNATHVLRQVLMLLTGKRVGGGQSGAVERHGRPEGCDNAAYAASKLAAYKRIISECLGTVSETDSLITIGLFIRLTRSQSTIRRLLQCDCSVESIRARSRVYEHIPAIASGGNRELLYGVIKGRVMELAQDGQGNYFLQSFVRAYGRPERIFRRLVFSRLERNSNVVLALLESLQTRQIYDLTDQLIRQFYQADRELFAGLLYGRDEQTLDTKYGTAIANFMKMPRKHNFNVNSDFERYFSAAWLSSRCGRMLVAAYAEGSSTRAAKTAFFNERIDLFWNCARWREGKQFVRLLAELTTGHARKKAFEILGQCV